MKDVLIALNQQPIAVYPIYIDITGSVTAGLLLSQIMYWNAKMKGKEFYKNDAEYMEETRLTQSEFKTAKKIVSNLSFLTIERKGALFRTYYKVDYDELLVVLQRFSSSFTYELGSRLSTSQRGVNLRTIIGTKNTQKNTQENTTITENEFSDSFLSDGEIEDLEIQIYESKEKKERKKVTPKKESLAFENQVLDYLNEKLEKKPGQLFKISNKVNISLINARRKSGKWSLEDFKLVIDHKVSQWKNDPQFCEYLRPTTLFATKHEESYLIQAKKWHENGRCVNTRTSRVTIPLYRDKVYENPDAIGF